MARPLPSRDAAPVANHHMQVRVHLLSYLKDCLPDSGKRGQGTVDLPEGAHLTDLVSLLGVDRRLGLESGGSLAEAGWQVLINGQPEGDEGRRLSEGDLVAILPPLAGG